MGIDKDKEHFKTSHKPVQKYMYIDNNFIMCNLSRPETLQDSVLVKTVLDTKI